MTTAKTGLWTKIKHNIRNRLISGILLVMPFGVTLLVMRWLFRWVAGILHPVVHSVLSGIQKHAFLQSVPPVYVGIFISAVSIVILLVLLYIVGAIGTIVLGRRFIQAGENLVLKIPLIRTIYTATKQVMEAISMPERNAFKSVVVVEFPRAGLKAIGFRTGYIEDNSGQKYCKVFIPTTPNPTTGFFEIVPINEVIETSVSIEEGFKMIISGGIVSPESLNLLNTSPPPQR